MSNRRSDELQVLVDRLGDEIVKAHGAEALRIADVASNHHYRCRCATCLSWWAYAGPDGGEAGDYGPFTKVEVNAEQSRLGLEVTP